MQNAADMQKSQKIDALSKLRSYLDIYNGCSLKNGASNTVFGNGSCDANLMLIGEAPGAQEDKVGIPFCGRSGKLLDNILNAIGLKREDVYVTNTVFWRPPNNRRPYPEEISSCKHVLAKIIHIVNPKVILLVGSTAAESVLSSKDSVGSMRKKLFLYRNEEFGYEIKTFVIFHPSYLLRQPSNKKEMWYDLLYIRNYLRSQVNEQSVF